MNILVAEDDPTSQFILQKMLEKEGHSVTVCPNGVDALYKLQGKKHEVLLTDWMMPEMDGMELIRRVRTLIKPPPLIIVITSISSNEAKQHALESGADEFLVKPVYPKNVISLIDQCTAKNTQLLNPIKTEDRPLSSISAIPYSGIVIGASSGGPNSLKKMFTHIQKNLLAYLFIVLHGPQWMLEVFAETLQRETQHPTEIAKEGMDLRTGTVYIAPGDKHMVLKNTDKLTIHLDDSPAVNYVKPAIDPLFRSAADIFGPNCIGVVLTGMGCDGALGAVKISQKGGIVIAQDPKTAIVGSMPEKAIETGAVKNILPLEKIGEILSFYVKGKVRK